MKMMEINDDESCNIQRRKAKRESYLKYLEASSRKFSKYKFKRMFDKHLKHAPYTLPRTITEPRVYEKTNKLLANFGHQPTKLDLLVDSLSELTCTDSTQILNDLKNMEISTEEDVDKARFLLSSLTEKYRKSPLIIFTEKKLEGIAGEIQASKYIMQRVFEEYPEKGDIVWLKASIWLSDMYEVKTAMKEGLWANPNLKNLWKQSEADASRSRVLCSWMIGPVSLVMLWDIVVQLAKDEEDAKNLLHEAVEFCPKHVEFQLTLARLETYDNAMMVLNKAREKNPKEPAYWIMAAKLEEANGNTTMVGKVIENAIQSLQSYLEFGREFWIKEAQAAEKVGSFATYQAIIHYTIGIGAEDIDRKRTSVAVAEECKRRGSIETAKAIYAHAPSVSENSRDSMEST